MLKYFFLHIIYFFVLFNCQGQDQSNSAIIYKSEPDKYKIVNSIKDLRELKGISVGEFIKTRAYYSNLEGGNNLYIKTTNQLKDNGGTVIKGNDSSTYEMIIGDKVYLKQFGAKGNGIDGDHETIQKAVDCAIFNNVPVFAEEGTFIIDLDKNGSPAININIVDKPNQNFTLIGKGEKFTVFKEKDGQTQLKGRFTKMFFIYLNKKNNVGNIVFKNFTLDKNGRSNTLPKDKGVSEWEQAHCIGFNGKVNSSPDSIKSITFQNIHIVDKIGAGINYSSMSTIVGNVIVDNITDEPFSGRFGERGTLEIGANSTNIIFNKLNVGFMQIEPVKIGASTAEKRKKSFFTDCKIENLQYTESNGSERYSEVVVVNSILDGLTFRNITFSVYNCHINEIIGFINSPNGIFSNCQIKVPYSKINNQITSINPIVYRSQTYNTNIQFFNCDFIIDSNDDNICPKGFIIKSSSNLTLNSPDLYCTIYNCKFDNRAFGSVYCYANGNYCIENSKLSGNNTAVLAGSGSHFKSNLILENNDYTDVNGYSLEILDYGKNYTISIDEKLDIEHWKMTKTGSLNNFDNSIISAPVLFANKLPNNGLIVKGTIIKILSPNADNYLSYICTTSGYGNKAVWKIKLE